MNSIIEPTVIYIRPSCTDFARLLPGQPKFIARALPSIKGFERWEGTGMDQWEAAESLCTKLRKAGVKNNLTEGRSLTLIPEDAIKSRN